MNKLLSILVGAFLCFGAAILMPFAGEGAGISPIPSAWAAFSCDVDGDGYVKTHPKCPVGDHQDPDDSDPCIPDDTTDACSSSGGGGGGGGSLGPDISMDCLLGASWGDDPGDTINDDKLAWYEDGVAKVDCYIGGPSTPWPIRLVVLQGKGKRANERMVDVVLDDKFEAGSFAEYDSSWQPNNTEMQNSYPNLFAPAPPGSNGYPVMSKMDPVRLAVRPYRLTQTYESIHLLPWKAEGYEMGMHLGLPGTGPFSVSIASKHYIGNEAFTGINCEIDDPAYVEAILANAPGGAMQDVSVYLWDDRDNDSLPDAYTVTTGSFIRSEDDGQIVRDDDGMPTVVPGSRYAAVCSAVGGTVHFLGYAKIQFTLTAMMK